MRLIANRATEASMALQMTESLRIPPQVPQSWLIIVTTISKGKKLTIFFIRISLSIRFATDPVISGSSLGMFSWWFPYCKKKNQRLNNKIILTVLFLVNVKNFLYITISQFDVCRYIISLLNICIITHTHKNPTHLWDILWVKH